MQDKKSPKGNLEKRRTTFLIIGFVVVLGLVYAGFELFAPRKKPIDLGTLGPIEVPYSPDVPVTEKTPPPPPPEQQQKQYLLELVDKEIKINLDSIIFNPEFNEGEIISDYEPVPFIGEKIDDPPPIEFPEEMPEPIGGFEAMYAFLHANLKYPEIARNNGISGQVFIEFVIEIDGSISNVSVKAGVYPELDKEAVRVVKMMPKWKPGKQMGKNVRCLFRIPIRFTIN